MLGLHSWSLQKLRGEKALHQIPVIPPQILICGCWKWVSLNQLYTDICVFYAHMHKISWVTSSAGENYFHWCWYWFTWVEDLASRLKKKKILNFASVPSAFTEEDKAHAFCPTLPTGHSCSLNQFCVHLHRTDEPTDRNIWVRGSIVVSEKHLEDQVQETWLWSAQLCPSPREGGSPPGQLSFAEPPLVRDSARRAAHTLSSSEEQRNTQNYFKTTVRSGWHGKENEEKRRWSANAAESHPVPGLHCWEKLVRALAFPKAGLANSYKQI